MKRANKTPTQEAYTELQHAYDYFNKTLFQNKLPPCLITLQRKARTYGYFSQDRFQHINRHDVVDEIAMNPDYFKSSPLPDILSTLVHEMIHLQQRYFGTPSRKGYHNKEWASMMEDAGLVPSSTGKPGGNRVGQQMSHYIKEGGPFDCACTKLIKDGFQLSWADSSEQNTEKKTPTRVKYTCLCCGLNAWAKPHIELVCGECNFELTEKQP